MFTRISLEQAQALLKNPNLCILDVRNAVAYQAQHIAGAQPIARDNLAEFCAAADKSKPVLVYCNHGNSSQAVAQYLGEQGFTEVFSLDGGFEAWRTQYDSVHS